MPDVIVEVERDSALKYEIDETVATGPTLRLDRILTSSMTYPGNYGYIPHTLSEDGDPLDALVLVPYKLQPGSIVACRAIGVLIMTDEKGLDEKVLMVPEDDVDPNLSHVSDLNDLNRTTLDTIEHFFTYYKTKEKGKWSRVEGFKGRKEAERLIKLYQEKLDNSLKEQGMVNYARERDS